MGHKLNTPFGIPACPLTSNSRYVEFYSKLGFDLLTFKTFRSIEWRGFDSPNLLYVNLPYQLKLEDLNTTLISNIKPFSDQGVSIANSFGVHSTRPEYWIKEYELAKSRLKKGQLLILSLMISDIKGKTQIENAIELAGLANQTSATIVEINFACPNTDGHGLIYEDIDLTFKICYEMYKVLENKKLLVKVGFYKDQLKIKEFLYKTKGIISGLSSTNTYGMKVLNTQGDPAFGNSRLIAGISGTAIKNLSIGQVKNILAYKEELSLVDFIVIGIGGIMQPTDAMEYLSLGVNAVQSATGTWVNPYLALEFRNIYFR